MFEIIVLGSEGGPLECYNSCYLVKPAEISLETILKTDNSALLIQIDAGSGLNSVVNHMNSPVKRYYSSIYGPQIKTSSITSPQIAISTPFKSLGPLQPVHVINKLSKLINSIFITHSHLDHVKGIVINSAGLRHNSSTTLYGSAGTIEALQTHIFNNLIWPNMISNRFVSTAEVSRPVQLSQYTVTPFQLDHGCIESTAYLVSYDARCVLVFGDFEPSPKTVPLWTAVSKLVQSKQLNSIIIECSSVNLQPEQDSFGHLTPATLFGELKILDRLVKADGHSLRGLQILVTHVKDVYNDEGDAELRDPKIEILDQLNELEAAEQLGVQFTLLLSNTSYIVP